MLTYLLQSTIRLAGFAAVMLAVRCILVAAS